MILPAGTMAVVVGIEQYETGNAWRLDGPALDACRFAQWLTTRSVPADRIILLVSPLPANAAEVAEQARAYGLNPADANHDTVREIFTGYLQRHRSDLLIVYWGGHGVIEQEERRLLYADATTLDKRNLNLSALLIAMRSSTFTGHPRQICLVDACQNLVAELGWEGSMPNEAFAVGRAEPQRDQRVLLAASPGERAINVDGLKTGLFSQVLREALDDLPADAWPPDMDRLQDFINERFEQLRSQGRTVQIPSSLWFRSRSGDDSQLFASGPQPGRVPPAALDGLVLKYDEYRKLKMILDGAPAPKELRALYREATWDVVSPLPSRPDDLMSTVQALRNLVRPLPLFKFLVRFAASSDVVTQDRLWDWINVVAPRWVPDMDELVAVDLELRRTYLLLRLQPDLLGEGFLVTSWQYEGSNGRQAATTDQPWNRERLTAEVGRMVDGFDPEQESVLPVIEFLVPLPMVDDEWEALRVRIAGREQAIGTAYPVVVRALDRFADPDGRERWRARWKELTARGDAYDEAAICWVECASADGQFDPGPLYTRMCTALAYARPYGPEEDPVLRAALSAGTPVVLWHRASSACKTRRAALEQVLRNRGLRGLPDVVFSQRVAAHHPHAAADHAGRDLVLLWDDADRIPAELEWHPPALEGAAP